jgi:hypothetical protein
MGGRPGVVALEAPGDVVHGRSSASSGNDAAVEISRRRPARAIPNPSTKRCSPCTVRVMWFAASSLRHGGRIGNLFMADHRHFLPYVCALMVSLWRPLRPHLVADQITLIDDQVNLIGRSG